jgi:preprotein translocase subunit SecE
VYIQTGVAQLVEHWSPKPGVGSSSLSSRASITRPSLNYRRKKMINYIKESVEELKNQVSWPSRQESSSLMVTVAVFSILFALLTWGVDSVFSRLIQVYFSLIK